MIPALLIRRSRRECLARNALVKRCTDSRSERSSSITSTSAPGWALRISSALGLAFSRFRQAITTVAPLAARMRAVSKPIPLLDPVTTAMRPVWSPSSSAVQFCLLIIDSSDFPGWVIRAQTESPGVSATRARRARTVRPAARSFSRLKTDDGSGISGST